MHMPVSGVSDIPHAMSRGLCAAAGDKEQAAFNALFSSLAERWQKGDRDTFWNLCMYGTHSASHLCMYGTHSTSHLCMYGTRATSHLCMHDSHSTSHLCMRGACSAPPVRDGRVAAVCSLADLRSMCASSSASLL